MVVRQPHHILRHLQVQANQDRLLPTQAAALTFLPQPQPLNQPKPQNLPKFQNQLRLYIRQLQPTYDRGTVLRKL